MTTSNDSKLDSDQIMFAYIQYVNEASPNISTDPNVCRIKVIKPEPESERGEN
jgi:hypothetical protein